jgi:hypothetical protein
VVDGKVKGCKNDCVDIGGVGVCGHKTNNINSLIYNRSGPLPTPFN